MAERWLQMQASSNSRYPRASHDSYHAELEEHRTPPSGRRTANKRQSMPTIVQSDTSPDRSTATQGMFRAGNERLYEAYNDLHSLAQDFEKPFDAPAILVVGHQTDGKSGVYLGCCKINTDSMCAVQPEFDAEHNACMVLQLLLRH